MVGNSFQLKRKVMFMKKIKVMMLAMLLAVGAGYAESGTNVYVRVNFESDTVGTNPVCSYSTPGGASTTTVATASAHVWVVGSSPIGTGQALDYVDYESTNAVNVVWDALPMNPSGDPTNQTVSSLRYDFTFSPLRTDGTSGQQIFACVAITNGSVGSSANRFASTILQGNGTITFRAANLLGNIVNVVSGSVHKISMYLNDTANAITYTDPNYTASTNTLAAKQVVWWMDGVWMASDTLLGAGLGISGTTNGLARAGMGSTSASVDLHYNFDNIMISDVNYLEIPTYLLTVNGGTGSGYYTNKAPVTIAADTSDTNKGAFFAWIGNTGVLVSNTASTTILMTNTPVTLTATYGKTKLTVVNGTGSGYYTNGTKVQITANAPANPWQKFNRWLGDVQYLSSNGVLTTTVTLTNLDAVVNAGYAGFFHDFEDEANLGGEPTVGGPGMPSMTVSNYSHVVTGTTNTAGTGKAVEIFDDSLDNGTGLEYNITPSTNGYSAASARFAFSWKNLGGVGTHNLFASFAGYGEGRTMSGSAGRWQDLRLYDNGTIIVSANSKTITPDGGGIQLVSGEPHTMNVFANDYDSQSVSYTVNGTPHSLGANSVAYWLDGVLLTFSNGMESTSMDLVEVGATSGNLGKYGLGTGSPDLVTDYVIDNFGGEELNTNALLYSLSVNSGSGMGLYTNGQQVTVSAMAFTNKNFLMWTGDTQYLTDSNSATTTVNMPAAPISLTAKYDRFLLTVNSGSGSGAYTNGQVVAITADAAPAGKKFTQWVDDVATVANVKSTNTTITMPGADSIVTAQYAGFFNDFESDTAGVSPTNYSPAMTTQYAPTNTILVVNSAANTAGAGNAVELLDNDSVHALGLEYNFTTAGGISAAKASFAFAWKNLSGNQTNGISASFGAYNPGRTMGSASARWTEARLLDRGAVDFATQVGSATEDQSTALIDGVANTMTIFANDYDAQPVTYKVNGTTYTLPTNSVAYWLNGKLVTFNGGAQYVSIDTTDTNGVVLLGASENNFGKIGFASSSAETNLDYIIDNIQAGEMDTNTLYALVVNNGGSGGLYTSGQQVAIEANVIAGRTFAGWIGNVEALSGGTNSSTTVTMPASGVTLTATYNNTALTVVNGSGSGIYTNGNTVTISATNITGAVFLAWTGDIAVLTSNTASTTFTIPNYDITLTATYGYSLTVIGGTGSGSYTNKQQVSITAGAAPSGQFFDKWTGDTASVARVSSIYAPSAIVTMTAAPVTLTSTYKAVGMTQNFENEIVGLPPSNGNPIVTSVLVVDASANTAGTGQAVELLDNSIATSMGLEYAIAGSPGLSAAKASFAFSWKNLGGTNGDQVAVAFGENTGSASKWLGSSAHRWTEARLCNNGTVDFVSAPTTNAADAISNNNNPIVANMANTMTIFANDYNSTAASYVVNGATNILPANSVAYWLNGAVVLFGANPYAPMDLSETNAAGQTIAASEGNLGKFGFSSTTAAAGLDYIVDDLVVSKDPWTPESSLVVIGGGGGGLYTNGQQVAIAANQWPGRTFVAWVGDTAYLSANASNAVVTMPATGVTLTATYNNTVLTVNHGTGSGIYTNANVVAIAAEQRAGVSFKAWTGTGTGSVASVTASNTTVNIPANDITLTGTFYYDLAVTSGSGSGWYTNNAPVTIAATPLTGKDFVQWTGDTNVLSSNTVSTTFTMSTNPVSLTATYVDHYYTLVVNSGSGDGSYTNGTVVPIVADPPDVGLLFDKWTGDTQHVASVTASNTWITITNGNSTVNATYVSAAVTLIGEGSTGGSVSPASTNASIGGSANFVITASNFYRIATVKTNGTDVVGVTFNNSSTNYNFTWSNVQAAGTLHATFTPQVTTVSSNCPIAVPYSWLATYFTTNDYNACALADQDADGAKTWQEYIAGTLPNSAASVLKATQNTRNVLTWTAQAGRVYSVYWSTNLVKGFTALNTNVLIGIYTNTSPDSRVNHYQIRVSAPSL